MDSNECAKMEKSSIKNTPWEDDYESDEYEFLSGYPYSGNYRAFDFINNTKPKLSVDGEKMKILVNKLFGPVENEHA
jgi:hypothetical protein